MWKNNNSKMHGLSEIGPNVPAFLIKLWKLVNDPEIDDIICWSEFGMSFIINKPAQFAKELLSLYFKHNNMASFIRQLNMYGFHKIVSEVGGTKNDKDYMEFAHQCFIKGHPYLLENIKRKLPNPKSGVILNEQLSSANVKNGTQSEILAKILSDVNNLKEKQESWDARLASMKRENEALWRELAIFRQKHLKQEQIINKLIHFIVTIVQPSRNVPLRRKYPLMLNGIPPVKKITKLSGPDTTNINQGSPLGPTIHEIDTSDVLFQSSEQPEVSSTDIEFMSSDLGETSPKYMKVEDTKTVSKEHNSGKPTAKAENIPENWLEVQLTEGDLIDPLTPIDPAKINPAVAAATLKHLEESNKTSPIAITIPSITTSTESGKKNVTEKKVIYLTDLNKGDKVVKKNVKKPIVLKLDVSNTKSSNYDENDSGSSSTDSFLDLLSKSGEVTVKSTSRPNATTAKRKMSALSSKATSPKNVQISNKKIKKADSKSCVPELEIDDLEFLLTAKQPDDVVDESKESETDVKSLLVDESSDPFLKFQSLYNGTITEDQLNSPKSPLDITPSKENNESSQDQNSLSPVNLVDSNNFAKVEAENGDDVLNFEPDSMAVVCQPASGSDTLTRELSSHVDSVQGEIDYLKEMLKGEVYNLDTNSLPWLFSDDPLSYGVLPSTDEESSEKKTEEAGNELMTYGSPNLMDLVDMIGSTPSMTNVLSPTSPIVADLATPAPSPSTFSFPTPTKRRKK